MKIVKTLLCSDGVIGLNGWQYLLDKNNNKMKFKSTALAHKFLLHNGYSQEWIDEWVETKEEK